MVKSNMNSMNFVDYTPVLDLNQAFKPFCSFVGRLVNGPVDTAVEPLVEVFVRELFDGNKPCKMLQKVTVIAEDGSVEVYLRGWTKGVGFGEWGGSAASASDSTSSSSDSGMTAAND